MFPHFCMHFTGFQYINESTTNSLPSVFLLSLAPVLNTSPTFLGFIFLPDSFVPPLTLVCFKSLLSIQSQLANILLHTKAVKSETNSNTTSGMLLPSILSKLLSFPRCEGGGVGKRLTLLLCVCVYLVVIIALCKQPS